FTSAARVSRSLDIPRFAGAVALCTAGAEGWGCLWSHKAAAPLAAIPTPSPTRMIVLAGIILSSFRAEECGPAGTRVALGTRWFMDLLVLVHSVRNDGRLQPVKCRRNTDAVVVVRITIGREAAEGQPFADRTCAGSAPATRGPERDD